MPFAFARTEVQGVVLIDPKIFPDERGFFMESYKRSDFDAMGLNQPFVQENHSRSTYGTLRGLHYQRQPKAQGKLVRVIVGEIFDVAVDIRRDSPTFGKWVGTRVSAINRRLVYVPPGCAHGFCVVTPEAEVIYKTTEEYAPDCVKMASGGMMRGSPFDGLFPIQSFPNGIVGGRRSLGWHAPSSHEIHSRQMHRSRSIAIALAFMIAVPSVAPAQNVALPSVEGLGVGLSGVSKAELDDK